MFESIVLGIVTGVTTFLPVPAEGITILLKNHFFGLSTLVSDITLVWFLQLGPAVAAIIYFRKDIKEIFRTLIKYRSSTEENKKLLGFLVVTTMISGFIAVMIREAVSHIEGDFVSSNLVNILLAAMLFVIGLLYLRSQKKSDGKFVFREITDTKEKDRFIVGVAQGFSIIPGLSRTGLTAGLLILQRYKVVDASKLSLLMSVPMIIGANLVANLGQFDVTPEGMLGVISAGLFSYLIIIWLFKLKDKFDYGRFAIAFGFVILLSNFLKY